MHPELPYQCSSAQLNKHFSLKVPFWGGKLTNLLAANLALLASPEVNIEVSSICFNHMQSWLTQDQPVSENVSYLFMFSCPCISVLYVTLIVYNYTGVISFMSEPWRRVCLVLKLALPPFYPLSLGGAISTSVCTLVVNVSLRLRYLSAEGSSGRQISWYVMNGLQDNKSISSQ